MNHFLKAFYFFSIAFLFIQKAESQSNFTTAVNYIIQHKDLFGLQENEVAGIKLIDESKDDKTGMSHVYVSQYYKGVMVYNGVIGIHLNSKDEVVSYNTSFQANLDKRIKSISPTLPALISAQKALTHLHIPLQSLTELPESSERHLLQNEHRFAKGSIALKDMYSQLVLLPSDSSQEIILAWKVNIYTADAKNWWDVFIDAKTGNVITKNDAVISCNFTPVAETDAATQKNSSPDAANDFNVIARPSEAPTFASRSIINSPWNLAPAAASPFGWLNDSTISYTYTRGNNVWAYLDPTNNNTASVANSADGGSGLNFNFPVNYSVSPSTYTNAAITQLFYANNTMHDVWYNYGFTEASRNFQVSNNGKGGSANDKVFAEAQDSRDLTPCIRDNANMATPADGSSPRMQMYLWSPVANLKINSPSALAGNYTAAAASTFGPCLAATNVTGNILLADTLDACSVLKNDSAMAGKIALLYRGNCAFTVKVKNAQNAGAKGVIVINNVAGAPVSMSGTDTSITIPSIMITNTDGASIRNALDTVTVNATFNTTSPELDGDFDNGIMFHEYGHGITHRLTGNGSTCMSNAERGDEGWSDWYALVLTQKPGDNSNTARSLGTYVIHEPATGAGIRQYPYSYDMNVDPHTYTDVKTSGGEVHAIGEVWASALWDTYWLMINKYGYDPNIYTGTGGNNKTMQLVIDGLKLQVCSPGFLDSRDAILKADSADNAAANSCLIWSAFARRGMGFSARQGSSNNTNDQVASFDMPPTCSLIVLPVTLLSFKATSMADQIILGWKTAGEYNNAGFELQRKSSLNDPFATIANIPSKSINSAGADYTYNDINVAGNVLYYYQLVQKDADGKKNYSQVVTGIIKKNIDTKVSIYPNPAHNSATVQFGNGFDNQVSVKISDVFGRIMYNKTLSNVSNSTLQLNLSNFAAGVYQINITDKSNKNTLRIVKK